MKIVFQRSFRGATRLLPALIGRFASQFFALFRLQGSHAHLAAFLAALEPTFPAHLSHDLRHFILIHINRSNSGIYVASLPLRGRFMVHYHGGPFSDPVTAVVVWRGRHAMVSFARPEQMKVAADICQSFCLDNGAFSFWRRKAKPNFVGYYSWLDRWIKHPGCDFAVVPDCIGGTEDENDELLDRWPFERWHGCPVWHMHESLRRLRRLTKDWPRVAIGSSGVYKTPGSDQWWERMNGAMRVSCDASGIPRARLHGLRMLNPVLFSQLPLSSADSTNVCRNVQLDSKWTGPYVPSSKRVRGLVLVDRIESHNGAPRWPPRPV